MDFETASTTPLSNGPGIILFAVGFLTNFATASAAASLWSSVILVTSLSRAPRNMPGNPKTLLIWLGKSLRPVAMTAT